MRRRKFVVAIEGLKWSCRGADREPAAAGTGEELPRRGTN